MVLSRDRPIDFLARVDVERWRDCWRARQRNNGCRWRLWSQLTQWPAVLLEHHVHAVLWDAGLEGDLAAALAARVHLEHALDLRVVVLAPPSGPALHNRRGRAGLGGNAVVNIVTTTDVADRGFLDDDRRSDGDRRCGECTRDVGLDADQELHPLVDRERTKARDRRIHQSLTFAAGAQRARELVTRITHRHQYNTTRSFITRGGWSLRRSRRVTCHSRVRADGRR